ncbi:MAG: aspartate kinase [Promethearchaeota archaeon]
MNNEICVMKFGGSCLTGSESFGKIKAIVDSYQRRGVHLIFVASAFRKVTDALFELGDLARSSEKYGEIDKKIAELERVHTEVVDELFPEEYELFGEKVEDFLETRFSEIESILDQIKEFGIQDYYLDYLVSYGERLSTFILSTYLESRGYPSMYIAGEEIIITDDNYSNALPLYEYTKNRARERLVPFIRGDIDVIFCVTGYFGRNKIGYTTTMGRGGSDFTATILARVLAELGVAGTVRVVFWKDVDGLLFTNPEYCSDASLIRKIGYGEAKEMAFFGAKVLHPKCLAAIEKHGVPVEIRNFDKPLEGVDYTLISGETEHTLLKGISTVEDAALISVNSGSLVETPGVLGRIFSLMGDNKINVSLVSQSSSEVMTSFVVAEKDAETAVSVLSADEFIKTWFEVTVQPAAIIAIVGEHVKTSSTKSRVYEALAREGIDAIASAQSSDGLNVSLVVEKKDLLKAVNSIHEQFRTCNDH